MLNHQYYSRVYSFCWGIIDNLNYDVLSDSGQSKWNTPLHSLVKGMGLMMKNYFSQWYDITAGTGDIILSFASQFEKSLLLDWVKKCLESILKLKVRIESGLIRHDEIGKINSEVDDANEIVETIVPEEYAKYFRIDGDELLSQVLQFNVQQEKIDQCLRRCYVESKQKLRYGVYM